MPAKKKILVIDDEEDIVTFTKSMLERTGKFDVLTSTDSEIGVGLAKNERPDLILLDINMPQMDGGAVASHLRDCSYTAQIPIIFVTGLLKKEEAEGKGLIGKNFYMAKPIAPKELVDKIDSVLLNQP